MQDECMQVSHLHASESSAMRLRWLMTLDTHPLQTLGCAPLSFWQVATYGICGANFIIIIKFTAYIIEKM